MSQVYNIKNINNILFNTNKLNEIGIVHIENVIKAIENVNQVNYYEIRDLLYNLLIFDVDISEFLFYSINYFICKKKLDVTKMEQLLYDINHFFIQYNNNYRPIFHLETIFYKLCIAINKNGNSKRICNRL